VGVQKLVHIEFDPAKDAANVAKHGLALAEAQAMDLATAAVLVDDRQDYGETRYRAFGRIDGRGYCFVFTLRPGAVRAISFRRAHDEEMQLYDQ
jgi:uncharacterized DUF497 family protein